MTTLYQPFEVEAEPYGGGDTEHYDVILSSDRGQPAMRIESTEQYIYITKAQAMAFFGLVDPPFVAPDYKY